jgi:hypothetical protein
MAVAKAMRGGAPLLALAKAVAHSKILVHNVKRASYVL